MAIWVEGADGWSEDNKIGLAVTQTIMTGSANLHSIEDIKFERIGTNEMIYIFSPKVIYLVLACCVRSLKREAADKHITQTMPHELKSGEQKADDARSKNVISDRLGLALDLLAYLNWIVFGGDDSGHKRLNSAQCREVGFGEG